MKKGILIAFTKSDKIIRRLSALLFCVILSLNLSAQKIHTLLTETRVSGNWQNSSLETFTYDGSNFLLNALSQTWDVPSVSWMNSSQSNYTNNVDGTANLVTSQSWDGVSAWNDATRTTYTYNASKKVLTAVTEIWIIAWQNLSKQTNTYDGSGFLTNSLTQSWDGVSAWKNTLQINYTNNADGTPSEEITQLWDGVSAWNNSHRSTITYNASKKVLTDISDTWVTLTSSWLPNTRETNTYDGSGKLTNSLSQLWDAGSTSWKNDTQSIYTNNSDGTIHEIDDQKWDGISAWEDTDRSTFTYSSATLTPEFLSEESFTIYPNPASDFIKIEANKDINGLAYSITDQAGKLVLRGKLVNENTAIDISPLTNGIYFLHTGAVNQHSYKIIKNQSR